MSNEYIPYYTNKPRRCSLIKTCSMPLFNTYKPNNANRPLVDPDILKMQIMENRLKYLEKQKLEQNEQINRLMQYQLNQNRLNKSSINSPALLLSACNILPPLGYHLTKNNKENGGYISPKENYYLIKEKKKKEKKIKEYKKNIEELKELLEKERMRRKMHKNLKYRIYNPIKNEMNSFMDKVNYDMQKKMENDNNILNQNLNEVQNSYAEIKNLLKNKIDKLELKQKLDFENFKKEILNTPSNNALKQKKFFNNNDYDNNLYESELKLSIEEQLRNQRELANIQHQRELDELRRKHELEDIENKKIVEELRYNNMRNNILNQKSGLRSQIYQPQPQMMQYPMPFMYPMPIPTYNNTSHNNSGSDELIKLFMMKQIFGEELFPKKKKAKKYFFYPPPYIPYPIVRNQNQYPSSSSGVSFPRARKDMRLRSKENSSSKKDSKKSEKSDETKKDKKKKKKKESEDEENEEDENEEKENEEKENEEKEGEGEEGEDGEGEGEGDGEDEGGDEEGEDDE